MLSIRKGFASLINTSIKLNKLAITPSCQFSIQTKLQDKRFTQKHEWISLKGDIGTVGISEYAQDKLGEVVYIELPAQGAKFESGSAFCTLESVKAVGECYMPVSGTVQEVNTPLTETPNIINKSPFDQGWLIKVKVDNKADVEKLMNENQYKEYLKTADQH